MHCTNEALSQHSSDDCSADVAVICFSVVNRRSLTHVETHWLPEIRRHCPGIPIVVCAAQIDLRYLYKDPVYIAMEKGSFIR